MLAVPAVEIALPVHEHRARELDRVAHAAQAHDADAALLVAARDHDAGFELVGAVAGEDGAVAGVEEGVVLEEGDGEGGGVEGAVGEEVVVCGGEGGEEGAGVGGVFGGREVGGEDVAGAAVEDEAGWDWGIGR